MVFLLSCACETSNFAMTVFKMVSWIRPVEVPNPGPASQRHRDFLVLNAALCAVQWPRSHLAEPPCCPWNAGHWCDLGAFLLLGTPAPGRAGFVVGTGTGGPLVCC